MGKERVGPNERTEGDSSRRRVRFAPLESLSTTFLTVHLEDFSSTEFASYWWTYEDEGTMQKNAKETADVAGEVDNLVETLNDHYGYVRKLTLNLEGTDDDYTHDIFTQPGNYISKLRDWTSACTSPRGLEQWASSYHKLHRVHEVRNYQDAVVHMSEMGLKDIELAEHCRAMSATARVLARLLGHADFEARGGGGPPSRRESMEMEMQHMSRTLVVGNKRTDGVDSQLLSDALNTINPACDNDDYDDDSHAPSQSLKGQMKHTVPSPAA